MELNNKNILDIASNEKNFQKIAYKLHKEGKDVIGSNPKISETHSYMITPDKKAYLVKLENREFVKLRELTAEEYKIIGIEDYE